MEAGRELDCTVAEKVMKLETEHTRGSECAKQITLYRTGSFFGAPPAYSTDIAAAWQVVEKMTERYHWRIVSPFDPRQEDCRLWFAGLTPHSCSGWNGRPDYEEGAETPALAICLAALKAIREDVDEPDTRPECGGFGENLTRIGRV